MREQRQAIAHLVAQLRGSAPREIPLIELSCVGDAVLILAHESKVERGNRSRRRHRLEEAGRRVGLLGAAESFRQSHACRDVGAVLRQRAPQSGNLFRSGNGPRFGALDRARRGEEQETP
jgi:hypothetical protein